MMMGVEWTMRVSDHSEILVFFIHETCPVAVPVHFLSSRDLDLCMQRRVRVTLS